MHYLDHVATTPLAPEALAAMQEVSGEVYGNPSSVHSAGRRAREVLEDARERVALAVGADPSEIAFTGGGTESVNLALKGGLHKRRGNGNHLVVSAFEHHAVLRTAERLGAGGYEVSFVPVGGDGVVDPEAAAAAVRPSTLLVSVMTVNNEVGTIQPVQAIANAVKRVNPSVLVHTDAVQALGNIGVDVNEWGVDLASFAAHKLGGPKGVGALFVRAGVAVEPLIYGGGQERGLRSGTPNVAGSAGFGAAAEVATKELEDKAARVRALRDRLLAGILEAVPDALVNGDLERRVAGNLNVGFVGAEGDTLLLLLDREGIACSSGSACSSGAVDPSHVLKAMGVGSSAAVGSIRFSFGRTSTEGDVDAVLRVLPGAVRRARGKS